MSDRALNRIRWALFAALLLIPWAQAGEFHTYNGLNKGACAYGYCIEVVSQERTFDGTHVCYTTTWPAFFKEFDR